jgi:acyl-CoA synthetase (AMP-forming)/AMP-acid ligase II
MGLRPGDRAILQVESLRDYFPIFWACVLGGITPVTVAIASSYDRENGVVGKLFNTWQLLERPPILASDHLVEALAGLSRFLPMEGVKLLPAGRLRHRSPSAPIHQARPDEVLFFQLTSGSTGIPKAIQETHQGIIHHIHGSSQFNGYEAGDVSLNWLPVDHVVPILTYHLKDVYLGCRQIQAPTSMILADPLKWLDLIEKYRVTHSWSPNFGFKLVSDQLAKRPEKSWDLSSIKFLMNAGEQVTFLVVRNFLNSVAPLERRPGPCSPPLVWPRSAPA